MNLFLFRYDYTVPSELPNFILASILIISMVGLNFFIQRYLKQVQLIKQRVFALKRW